MTTRNRRAMNEALVLHGRICQKCALSKNIEVHHLVAVAEGGDDEITNLMVLCRGCHSEWHHTVELADESHVDRHERFQRWLSIPPTWFLMAYAKRNGLAGGFDDMVETFRTVMAVNKVAQANVSKGELQFYFDQMRDHEQTAKSNAILIGLDAARQKGIKLGRPPMDQTRIDQATQSLLAGNGVRATARNLKMSPGRLSKLNQQLREAGMVAG